MNTTIYIDQIISSIVKNNENIEGVKDFEVLRMIDYTARNHKKVIELVNNGTIDQLKDLPEDNFEVNEGYDLIAVKFADDQGNAYIGVIYDSTDLWQDPEALEVIPLPLEKRLV